MNPSSDTATHVELYKAFPNIGESCTPIPPWATKLGAGWPGNPLLQDHPRGLYVWGNPLRAESDQEEIEEAYEKNTGVLIAEYFKDKDYVAMPAVLCKNHGPFTWGKMPTRRCTTPLCWKTWR